MEGWRGYTPLSRLARGHLSLRGSAEGAGLSGASSELVSRQTPPWISPQRETPATWAAGFAGQGGGQGKGHGHRSVAR